MEGKNRKKKQLSEIGKGDFPSFLEDRVIAIYFASPAATRNLGNDMST